MVAENDKIAWERWLELKPELGRVLARHCANRGEVEDMIQETYLRAGLYGRLAPTGRTLKAWLVRIAMNALADWKNREGRYQSTVCEGVLPEDMPSEEEEFDGEGDLRVGRYLLGFEAACGLMRRTLGAFEGSDRMLLESVYELGHDKTSTAQRCRIPEHLVKGRVYRARQRLSRAMRHRAAVEYGVRQ